MVAHRQRAGDGAGDVGGQAEVVEEGRSIALFFTGRRHAGENLAEMLTRRAAELGWARVYAGNVATLAASPFHFVSSLVPSQHADLLTVPRRRFRALVNPRLEGVEVFRTEKKVFGRAHTAVVTASGSFLGPIFVVAEGGCLEPFMQSLGAGLKPGAA